VWRAANAGLMCCNACGMYFKKHRQHRPEHLLAANKAKQDARQASAATTVLQRGSGAAPADTHGAYGGAVACMRVRVAQLSCRSRS
jgi:hypothetical protein